MMLALAEAEQYPPARIRVALEMSEGDDWKDAVEAARAFLNRLTEV